MPETEEEFLVRHFAETVQVGCGCCGRVYTPTQAYVFCDDCLPHIDPDRHKAPWDRTYSAIHGGERCPFDETARHGADEGFTGDGAPKEMTDA